VEERALFPVVGATKVATGTPLPSNSKPTELALGLLAANATVSTYCVLAANAPSEEVVVKVDVPVPNGADPLFWTDGFQKYVPVMLVSDELQA
jgi:hypothetical protein